MNASETEKNNERSDELKIWQEMSGIDVLKELGTISKEEYDYYQNLK